MIEEAQEKYVAIIGSVTETSWEFITAFSLLAHNAILSTKFYQPSSFMSVQCRRLRGCMHHLRSIVKKPKLWKADLAGAEPYLGHKNNTV